MKKTMVSAVIVILVLLALPFVTGMITESHVRQRLSAMSANSPLTADVTEYERGWFASSARIELRLGDRYVAQFQPDTASPGPDFLSQRVPVLVELRHGPVVAGDGIAFGMSRVVARTDPDAPATAALHERLAVPHLFELRGNAGFGGGFEFEANAPPVDYSGDGTEVTFSGLAVDGTIDGDRVVANAEMAALDYENPFAAAAFEDVRVVADYALGEVAIGAAEIDVGAIVVTSALLGPQPLLDARTLRVRSAADLDDSESALRVAIEYSAESLTAGPRVDLADMEFALTFAELDAAAMRDYYAILRRTAPPPVAAPEALLAELEPVLERLLERGPTLTLDPIRFSLDGEPVSASVRAVVDPAGLPAGGGASFQDPALWLAVVAIDADAQVSKALAQRAAMTFARGQVAGLAAAGEEPPSDAELDAMAEAQAGFMLVALAGQGYIEDAGERYETMLRYARGTLTLNGIEVPMPALR